MTEKQKRNLIESCCRDINRDRGERDDRGKRKKKGEKELVKERDGALGKDQSLVPGDLRQMK